MYLIVLQAVFAGLAWRKGWRWRVLIPFVGGLALQFGLGIVLGVTGLTDPSAIEAVGFFTNALILGAIALMVIKPPRSAKGVDAPPSALSQELSGERN